MRTLKYQARMYPCVSYPGEESAQHQERMRYERSRTHPEEKPGPRSLPFSPGPQPEDFLDETHHADDDRRVETLEVGTQLVGGEELLWGGLQVEQRR